MHNFPYTLNNGGEILGHTYFSADANSKTTVASGFKEPETETANKLFDIVLASLAQRIQQEKKRSLA